MGLDVHMNAAAKRFALQAARLPERVDIEEQSGTAGTASATPGWSATVSDWPCFSRPAKESRGARSTPEMDNAPSYSHEFFGPAVTVSGANGETVTAITISKEMRLRVKSRGAQAAQIFSIVDFALVSSVELKILATRND